MVALVTSISNTLLYERKGRCVASEIVSQRPVDFSILKNREATKYGLLVGLVTIRNFTQDSFPFNQY